ncbi:MAG: hypothetical protein JXB10_13090 [Pirellulales bacterium]|nr:hypothetical protein [Pirellulales bacterium]
MLKKRPIRGWGFLALFSIITVTGEALHFLPGMGHSCTARHHGEGCCHVHAATAAGLHADQPAWCAADRDEQVSCESCPLCQYFSQAKNLQIVGDCGCEPRLLYTQCLALPPIFFWESPSAYQSRGPPAALWIS